MSKNFYARRGSNGTMVTTRYGEGMEHMRRAMGYFTQDKKNAMKTLALAVLLCFVFLTLLSEAFLLSHVEHKHEHNGIGGRCTVCVQFQNAESLRKMEGMSVNAAHDGLLCLFTVITMVFVVPCLTGFCTLVQLKTRLNH